jgi:hypothetical protein
MKTSLALAAAGAMILAPAIAAASQPAQPADPSSTQAQSPAKGQASGTKKSSAQTGATCGTGGKAMGKSAYAKADHDPSAMPGKDTGWVPPPRKKPASEPDSGCAAQSH